MATFEGFVLTEGDGAPACAWSDVDEADLMDGDVTVEVSHSSLNYKDGLAITGSSPVVRRWPMIPGIDLVGTVRSSDHADVAVGDAVVCNGWGMGETHLGGWATLARVPGDWLVPLPAGITAERSMAIGTAGYTAMLCVLALERHGVTPDAGPVLVTGASGGVGSVAVAILANLGHEVVASTGRRDTQGDFLRGLGASDLVDRGDFEGKVRPLAKERWAGAIDTVGSATLANVCAQTSYGGTVAACGLVGGMDLPASVAPFILRGVTLAGVDSVMTPMELRRTAWDRLSTDLPMGLLDDLSELHPIADAPDLAGRIVQGQVHGRIVFSLG